MQCELLGATAIEYVPQLIELLTGLSGRPGVQSHHREILIKSQASPFTELHLVQQASDGQPLTGDSWEVCHEGIPVRGKGFVDLPAVVRSRTSATCQGAHSLSFWTHLGFSVSYELVKKGFTFTIFYDDHELQVLLCSVNPGSLSQQQAEVQTTAVCDQFWLLKITAIAPEASQQAQAAHAIGALSMQLQWVDFRKG